MSNPRPPKIVRFSAAKQRRMDQLLDKNSEGTISLREKATLEKLVAEAERLMAANAKRLAKFTQGRGRGAQAGVPVTVWLKSEPARR